MRDGLTPGIDPAGAGFRQARRGMGCLVAFALPFLAGGVFAGFELVRGLTGDSVSGMPPEFAAIFMLASGGFGIAMIAAARFGKRRFTQELEQRQRNPEQPWLWRLDWANGRVDTRQRAGVAAIAVFAFLWNAIAAPILFVLPDELAQGNTPALIGLAFPLVGVVLIIVAVRMWLRSRKYRGTHLELGRVPIPPGARFEATLHARFDGGPPERVVMRISCVRRRVTGSGKNHSVREDIVWQDERDMGGEEVGLNFGAAAVPVAFDIPEAAPSVTPDSGDDRIVWRLDIDAEAPGIDLSESFELPVFATGELSTRVDRADLDAAITRLAVDDGGAPPTPPSEPTVIIRMADPVGTEFVSAPGRHRAPLLPALLFLAIWFGFVALMVGLGAPLVLPVLFGAIGLVVVLVVVDLAFSTTRTLVTADGVTVTTRVLGLARTRHVPLGDVGVVTVKVGTSQNRSATQAARAWHDVVILRASQGKVSAARHVPTRAEAEWVAAELRRTLGLS